jgi:kynureninase
MTHLSEHYTRFKVSERLLLTGHSHQAWPDVAFAAQQQAFDDAAELIDRKWGRAAEIADEVRAGWRRLLGDPHGAIVLGQNTHELVVRLLSALPLWGRHARPRIVTTTGEFHTIRRQIDRLAEEPGVEVVKVPASPVDTLAERLAAESTDRTALVLVSSVLFATAEIVPGLDHLARACDRVGAALLVDAYHHLNVVPFDVTAMGLTTAFVTGGGYKYAQLGEGNCFLRLPPGDTRRPVITGWFSEFAELADAKRPGEVRYPAHPEARWAGATYDPVSHYRARAVFAFFHEQQLTPERLRGISQHQTGLLAEAVRTLDLDPAMAALVDLPAGRRAGFVSIRAPRAVALVEELRAGGVNTDARGEHLRLGPAPYLTDDQIRRAVEVLGHVVRRD